MHTLPSRELLLRASVASHELGRGGGKSHCYGLPSHIRVAIYLSHASVTSHATYTEHNSPQDGTKRFDGYSRKIPPQKRKATGNSVRITFDAPLSAVAMWNALEH